MDPLGLPLWYYRGDFPDHAARRKPLLSVTCFPVSPHISLCVPHRRTLSGYGGTGFSSVTMRAGATGLQPSRSFDDDWENIQRSHAVTNSCCAGDGWDRPAPRKFHEATQAPSRTARPVTPDSGQWGL